MGPMFCLMRARMAAEARDSSTGVPEFEPEFADDSFSAGRWDHVLHTFKAEIALAAKYGVDFDLSKCTLVVPTGQEFQGDLTEFLRLGVQITQGTDLAILKSPVAGKADFAQQFCQGKLGELRATFEAVSRLPKKHIALYLLRNCLSCCKVQYVLRTAPRELVTELAAGFDSLQREALEEILGLSLSDAQWKQAQLKTKRGGLGRRLLSFCRRLLSFLSSRHGCFV